MSAASVPSRSATLPAQLRVALFTDSYLETNGVGTLCREYASYARDRGMPFFCAYGGQDTGFSRTGSVHELQLRRGPLSFDVDSGVSCDPFLTRHRASTLAWLREFRPNLIHITGPGDVSILGFWVAHTLGVPLFASWHTNLHEYAHRRLQASLRFLPCSVRERVSSKAGNGTLWAVTKFYRNAHFLAAPNHDMVDLLLEKTGRPAFLIAHGVNTELFSPSRRKRSDARFSIGYVGRLTPEKNVRALVDLEHQLFAAGESDFRIVVVGGGSEAEWLRAHLKTGEFPGVLRGEALATAFANMDAFVFPSLTDTFGLVILEAMASGVPVIVNPETGVRVGVVDGVDGFLATDFAASVQRLIRSSESRRRMSDASREHACSRAWPGVFEDLHRVYQEGLRCEEVLRRMPTPKFDLPPARR